MNQNDVYRAERDISPQFLARVRDWIANQGEVLVVLRYLRAGGAKEFSLCQSMADFEQLIAGLPIGTDIEAFRDRQLPLRGIVDDDFISQASTLVGDGAEYLFATLATRVGSIISKNDRLGDSHADLRADLEDFRDQAVAFGPVPIYWEADSDKLISASVGGIDGPR